MSKRRRLSSEQIQQELTETATQLFVPVLKRLFTDPKMFASFDRFRSAGFHLVDHAETKIMAGSHKQLRGYLVKKYNNDRSGKDQLRNYMHRIEGARLLREFIAEHRFKRVVAPKKFLYELPSSFPERYLVLAEKLDLVSRKDTERAYGKLDREQGRELAVILYYFRGLIDPSATTKGAARVAAARLAEGRGESVYVFEVGEDSDGTRIVVDREEISPPVEPPKSRAQIKRENRRGLGGEAWRRAQRCGAQGTLDKETAAHIPCRFAAQQSKSE